MIARSSRLPTIALSKRYRLLNTAPARKRRRSNTSSRVAHPPAGIVHYRDTRTETAHETLLLGSIRFSGTPPHVSSSGRRYASSIAAVTTINATKTIPSRCKELYEHLGALKHHCTSYVDLSQLELALRGLESEDAVIRVAGRLRKHFLQTKLTSSSHSFERQWARWSSKSCQGSFGGSTRT